MDSILTIYISTIAIFLFVTLRTPFRTRPTVTCLQLNWVGRKNEAFSKLRAYMRQHTAGLQTTIDGYNKYNKKGLPFILPIPSMREIVMVPQEHISWLVDQKDSVLSRMEIRKKHLAIDWLLPTVLDPLHDLFMFDVVRRDLPRNLNVLQPIMYQELRNAIGSSMGLETDNWHETCLWQTMRTILRAVSNRVFFDLPLCEDRGFLKSMQTFSGCLGIGAFIAGQLAPWPLTPIIGSFVAIPVYIHLKLSLRSLLPIVKKRMDDIQRGKEHEQNSFITWHVAAVLNADIDVSLKKPEAIAQRLLLLSLATDHSMNVSTVNFFLDLLSSPPEHGYLEQLREEAQSVFRSETDWMDHTSLTKLPLTDSAIRESMRLNPVKLRGPLREVMPKDGVTLPDGNRIPKGAWLGTAQRSMHRDERFYSNANEYEPFRFDRSSQESEGFNSKREGLSDRASEYRKNVNLPSTSDVFIS